MPVRQTGCGCCGGIFAEFSGKSAVYSLYCLAHIFRQGAGKGHAFPGQRMTEGQFCGMQGLPFHAEFLKIICGKAAELCPFDKERVIHAV